MNWRNGNLQNDIVNYRTGSLRHESFPHSFVLLLSYIKENIHTSPEFPEALCLDCSNLSYLLSYPVTNARFQTCYLILYKVTFAGYNIFCHMILIYCLFFYFTNVSKLQTKFTTVDLQKMLMVPIELYLLARDVFALLPNPFGNFLRIYWIWESRRAAKQKKGSSV